jgi:hypothetical protein
VADSKKKTTSARKGKSTKAGAKAARATKSTKTARPTKSKSTSSRKRSIAADAGQYRVEGPALHELRARGLVAKAAWRGSVAELGDRRAAMEAAAGELQAPLPEPVRAPIDRTVPADVFSIDLPVKNEQGKVVAILRRPLGYPAGLLPGDPGAMPPRFDSLGGICRVLSPAAAARCAIRGRYA